MNWNLIGILAMAFFLLLTACDAQSMTQPAIVNGTQDTKPITPEDLVEAFYEWYLGQFNTDSGVFRSPLADRIYRDNEFLSEPFIRKLDELLDGFSAIGYDPLLCAQDIPSEIKVDGIYVAHDTAIVAVHTNFPDHYFSLDLEFMDANWIIDDINCSWTPEGTTKVFFARYLSNAFDATSGKKLPLTDAQNLRLRLFLSSSFLQRVDTLHNDMPIFLISQTPRSASIAPGPTHDSVIVTLIFEPGIVDRKLLISMIQEAGLWKINDISPLE